MYFVGLHNGKYILPNYYMLKTIFHRNRAVDIEGKCLAYIISVIIIIKKKHLSVREISDIT